MQTQVHLALSQIRDQLRRRKYKAMLAKICRIKTSVEIHCYPPLSLFELLRLQISAINKLLQRNLLKKYKYEYLTVQWLVDILERNIEEMHQILCEWLEERGEIAPQRVVPDSLATFPLVREKKQQTKIKLEKIEPFYRNQGVSTSRKYIEQFMKIVNVSLANYVQMALLYLKEPSHQMIASWAEIPGNAFVTIPGKLSHARTHLLLGKMLSVDSVNQLQRAQKILEHSTEQFIDCLHMANCSSYRARDQQPKLSKYKALQKQCTKLLMISLIMTNKNNMKLGKQQAALMGCQLIKNTVNGLGHGFGYFKRLLLPELYLLEQYTKYQEEKKQLEEITNLYFGDLRNKVECAKQQKQMVLKRGLNAQQKTRGCRFSGQRGLLDDIGTAKTITTVTNKRKEINSSIMTGTKSTIDQNRSRRIGDSILTKMIIGHIEELNTCYTKFKNNIGAGSYYKGIKAKHSRNMTSTAPTTLRKQKITPSNALISHQELTQRVERIKQNQQLSRRDTRQAKEKLLNMKKYNLVEDTLEEYNEPPVICQLQKEIDNSKQLFNMRGSEQTEYKHEQPEIKKRFHNLTKKTKIFVQILHLNKQALGIKKLVEKVDLLKKKQQQKQKMISNRITSLATRDKNSEFNNMSHFKVIASELMKEHISKQVDEDLDWMQKKKIIEASHALGQDSIKTIRNKLVDKMDRKERRSDRSDLNQEAFKQKLKRLGSTNFFLKRVSDVKNGSTERPSNKKKRVSANNYRRSKVEFTDLPLEIDII